MPDLERRSSASFISSNEGGTPASFSRSLMNRSSSYCLRVSISINPQFADAVLSPQRSRRLHLTRQALETNHERTLYVPYVFCNHLISRQQSTRLAQRSLNSSQTGSLRMAQGQPAGTAGAKGERITGARAAARCASSQRSWLSAGVATPAPAARASIRGRR